MFSRTTSFVCSGALAVAALQCKSQSTAPSQTPAAAADTQASTKPAPKAEVSKRPALSDSEIVAITAAANRAEIEQGQLAKQKAKDPRVRDFAAMMIDHHGDARREQQKLSVEPIVSSDSQRMQADAKDALQALQQKTGKEFDQAYLELQIDEHRKVLETLKQELVPAAKNASLKAYLEELQPRVESHLAQAERLQQEMGVTTSQNEHSDNPRPLISNSRGTGVRLSNR